MFVLALVSNTPLKRWEGTMGWLVFFQLDVLSVSKKSLKNRKVRYILKPLVVIQMSKHSKKLFGLVFHFSGFMIFQTKCFRLKFLLEFCHIYSIFK